MKKYEIAFIYNDYDYENADIETIEFDTFEEARNHIDEEFFNNEEPDENLYRIEFSVVEQDEDGCNNDIYTFMEIDCQMFYTYKV